MIIVRCTNETCVEMMTPIHLPIYVIGAFLKSICPVPTFGYICSQISTTLPKALGPLSCNNFPGFPCIPLAACRALTRGCHNIFLHSMRDTALRAKYGGPQPLENTQFWRNRDKNKLANKLRHLIDELNSSTCRLGFKPWCMSHTTRQESCTYGFRCVLGELGRFRKGTWFREPVPGSVSG